MEVKTEKLKTIDKNSIPVGWEIKSLGELGEIISGLTYSPDDVTSEGTLVLRSSNVQDRILAFEDNVFVKVAAKDFKPVEENDILICVRNGSKSLIGKNALITKEVENCAFGAFMGIYRSEYNNYFYQLFDTDYYKREIHRNLGATINSINGSDLKKFKFPIPPPPERKAIAKVLGKMDDAVNVNNQLIAQKELHKKWLMQNLLSGKKRLKGFSGNWKAYSYSKLLKEVKRTIFWDDNDLYKLISVRRRSGGIFFRDALYGHQIKVKNLRNVKQGDFLISKMQILHGASAFVTEEFEGSKISGSYIAVIAKDPKILDMEYFNWMTKMKYFYHQTYVSSYGVHIEKMTFVFKSFLGLECQIPSVEEQISIVKILKVADKEIELLKAKTNKLKEQKKWMMQVLLTGKKRLKIENN